MAGADGQHAFAGLCGFTRKGDAPWHGGDAAPKFSIDEICNAAQKQADGHHSRHQIGQRQHGDIVAPCKHDAGDDDTQKAAVKRHATFPDADNLRRVLPKMRGLIEQHIAQTPPDDHRQNDPCQQPFDRLCCHWGGTRPQAGRGNHPHDQLPSRHQTHDVGQRIPTQRKGEAADIYRENFGRQVGEGDIGHAGSGLGLVRLSAKRRGMSTWWLRARVTLR